MKTKNQVGRPPKYKDSEIHNVRFPGDLWKIIPGVKSDFIVAAVREKLKNEQASS